MSDGRISLGKRAEDRACSHLVEKGLEILGRNVRGKAGEVDIIAREGDCLVVVEVRSRRKGSHIFDSEVVGFEKRKRVARTAREVIPDFLNPGDSVRFDVVLVTSEKNGSLSDLNHIRNAFSSSGEII